jgi:integrase/recombinase XerD
MPNRKASVWKYVRVEGKWRYCRPVVGKNNKIKPDWVHVNSHEEHHPEGGYYIQYYEGSKQRWKPVGKDPAQAVRAAEFQEGYFHAVAKGVPVQQEKSPLMIAYTMPGYLEEYRLSHRKESYSLMKQTLEEFNSVVSKNIINQITRLDMLKYKGWLIAKGRSDRTAGNKMLRVNQYLRSVQSLKPGEGLVTVKDARFVQTEPEVYQPNELTAFFKACNPFLLTVFKTLLMSGLRKQEMESLTWDDVSFEAGTLKVSAKPGFSPKSWEERVIEIPKLLLDLLKKLSRKTKWVFANGAGNKYTHVWDDCNVIGKAAGIIGAHPHKFRATYATTLLQSGVDLKTVQKLLGHKNLESTMRYLARAQSAQVRSKVNAIWN